MIGRIIKPSGTRISLIFHDEKMTKKFLKSLYQKNIGGDGFGYLSVGTGWLYLYDLGPDDVEKLLHTGPMFLVERGVEPA
jgi:hypothetical protein